MRPAGQIVGAVMMVGLSCAPAMELSPDPRPVLLLQPPQGDLMLAHRALQRVPLPRAWRTPEPDRGFAEALQQQLSHGAANWPWRRLIDNFRCGQRQSAGDTGGSDCRDCGGAR
jgi:hypothetical protein